MNILVITNMYPSEQKPYSGLFVVNQVNEIKSILDKGDELDFFYMKRSFTNIFGTILKYLKFFFSFFRFAFKAKKKYDIVHVHYYFPAIYLALYYKRFHNKNCKIFVTYHGGDVYNSKKGFLYKYPFKKMSKAIAVSEYLADALKPIYQKEILNISAGINNIFEPAASPQEKQFDLIFVGSFYEVKGFDLLCEALDKIETPLRVCLIGSGPMEKHADKLLEKKVHQVEVLKNLTQSRILEKLHVSRFLVNTSRNESFGLSMTEAMACGIPVLATITDGSKQQITEKHNGFLIQETSAASIQAKILEVMDVNGEQYETLCKNSLAFSEKHKLKNVAREIYSLYKTT